MKKRSKLTYLFILWMSIALSGCGEKGYEIYVSPDGDDTARGKLSDPVATLHRAAELARKKTGKVPVTIFLSGGDYRLTVQRESKKMEGI